MSADKANMVISGSILPLEIQKKFTGGAYEYSLADNTEGYYYKLTDITNTSTDLIDDGHSFMQFGGTDQGAATGTDMAQTHANDKVKFLYIKHTGKTDDGSTTNTADSIYLCFDAGTAAHDLADAVEVGPNETWFAKLNCTVAQLHAISALKAKAGTSSNTVQAIVIAIIDNV